MKDEIPGEARRDRMRRKHFSIRIEQTYSD